MSRSTPRSRSPCNASLTLWKVYAPGEGGPVDRDDRRHRRREVDEHWAHALDRETPRVDSADRARGDNHPDPPGQAVERRAEEQRER